MATLFEKDKKLNTEELDLRIRERKSELDSLNKELRTTKNSFRRQVLKQEIERKTNEYKVLNDIFDGVASTRGSGSTGTSGTGK